ncbi:MAG: ATP synthase F1 subunit gamma [Acidobacteria bacterium]|nr:ATP synthase F1 subunit gamma [Acidobacteriota bacterium]
MPSLIDIRRRVRAVKSTQQSGLCGSFNTNVVKGASEFITEQAPGPGREIALALVGRKGRDFFMRRGFDVRYEEVGLFQNVQWTHARAIAATAIKEFTEGDVQSVYLVYNEFRSVMVQRVVVERLLPIPKLELDPAAEAIDYLFEPTPDILLGTLLPFHVAVQVNRALLESSAAEHAARMTAMDAATRNAREMVDRLTLYMNKVRQASITREIIEIVAGAQSV